jgi:hypothetical protein
MGVQSSGKRGVRSSSQKGATSRQGLAPMPQTAPVPGAFGQEGRTRDPRQRVAPKRGSARAGPRAHEAKGAGASSRPPAAEREQQRRLPARGRRSTGASAGKAAPRAPRGGPRKRAGRSAA